MVTETEQIEYTPLLEKTRDCKARTIVHVGGAGSSKSHSIAQLIIYKLTTEKNKRIGICRKTFPSLRMTALELIVDLLTEYGYYNQGVHNKAEGKFTLNTNVIQFFSMGVAEGQKERIKSTNFNYIWMEEANEFTYDDFMYLKLRLRNPTIPDEPNQMFLSLNPADEQGWIPQKLLKEDDVELIHSTYKDNPFIDEAYKKSLEKLIDEDENYYRIYTLGEWGRLENIIYPNYKLVDEIPPERQAMAYGLDFGYVNPSVLVKVTLSDNQYYLQECMYRSKLTNSDIIEALSHEERGDIYADRNELQMIEEIFRSGYNVYPSEKDVSMGINLCKRQTLNILSSSVNLIKEIKGYHYKKDKDGEILEEPVKFNDHLMDAMRYCIYGMTQRFGFATAKPGARKSKHSMRI